MATRRPALCATAAVGALVVLFHASYARAQSAPDTPAAVPSPAAQREFDTALEDAAQQRWGEALGHFRRAYEQTRLPSVLLNIAGTLVATGRLVEAGATYRRFLAEAPADANELRRGADDAIAQLDARTPRVVLRLRDRAAGDAVAIDGATITDAALGRAILVDPGPHSLAVLRDGATIARREFESIERVERVVTLDVPRASPSDARRRRAPPSVFASPVFWTVVGVVVAGAGAAIAAGAVVATAPTPPFVGNVRPAGFAIVGGS